MAPDSAANSALSQQVSLFRTAGSVLTLVHIPLTLYTSTVPSQPKAPVPASATVQPMIAVRGPKTGTLFVYKLGGKKDNTYNAYIS